MARGKRIPPDVRKRYLDMRELGFTRAETCRRIGVSAAWAKGFDRNLRDSSGPNYKSALEMYETPAGSAESAPGPRSRDELCPEALAALDDIGLFAARYFGLKLMPFQIWGTEKIMELEASPDEEYVVINQPPGSGKSTFYTLVLAAWKTARDRRLRGLMGSATDTQGKWYVNNLREALTTPIPITAAPSDLKAGIAQDALATLCGDYGRFRPEDNQRKWAQDAFYVEMPEGVATVQKEPTWSAFGRSSAFLGLRVPFAIWDDVYDPEKNRSAESRDSLKSWWSDIAEKRLEPGGLLVLQMQRLDPDDICRYALDMGGTVIREGDEKPRKYHHIVFKAHYDEHCQGDHEADARPYDPKAPNNSGCLLYPKRLGFAKLESEKENNPNFEMVYQQADVSRARALVDRLWIDGGTDPETREVYPGCKDTDRDLGEPPRGLSGRLLSIATADPSPTNFWGVIWWIVRIDPVLGPVERYVVDIVRQKMGANQFLDYNGNERVYSGLMHEWQARSRDLGVPITHWIVETNAAQRFMLQYEHVTRWIRTNNVTLLGHDTYKSNKSDVKYGVQTIGSHYRHGRVRLPYLRTGYARARSQSLVDELTRYPNGRTDDLVMSHWFLEWNLPTLVRRDENLGELVPWRPSWVGAAA